MFEERVRQIIEERYIELVSIVVDELKALPVQNLQDNNSLDTYFGNMWEIFVEQVQRDDDIPYHTTTVINNICQQTVQPLTLTELKLLWLLSDGCLEWDDDDFPDVDQMFDDVTEELISWVEQEAEEPELLEDFEDEDDDEYLDDDDEDDDDDSYKEDGIDRTRH